MSPVTTDTIGILSGKQEIPTRAFVAGAARFVVICPTQHLREVVESLFIDLDESALPIEHTLRLESTGSDELLVLVDGTDDPIPKHPDVALTSLVSAVSRLALDAEPERLHLHAAAVSRGGRGVLISAPSGTGKTTLAAALAHRGWAYTTDEAVAIAPEDITCYGFPKPLMIKPGGTGLVPDLRHSRVQGDWKSEEWWHIPASSIPASLEKSVEPVAIVILRRAADGTYTAPSTATAMHPVDAVVELLQQTMDPERFGPGSLAVLGELAAKAHCVELQAGPLDTSIPILESLVSDDPPLRPMLVLEPGEGTTRWSLPSAVRSVLIGDRVVAHNTNGGTIAALDEVGSAAWLAIHGLPPDWWSTELLLSESTIEFLTQLASFGLLQDAYSTDGGPPQ